MRHNSQADDSARAFADGLKSFNLDKGNACFLGIVVASGTQKELLPQLSPDWEQAVEPDLTRAIARLLDVPRPGQRHDGRHERAAQRKNYRRSESSRFQDYASISAGRRDAQAPDGGAG